MSEASAPADIEKNPSGVVKRWLLELKQADKREGTWRKKGLEAYSKYRAEDANDKGSFNILWANTETLRPAIYSHLPTPDVRRRFRDDDPLAKAASECLERCLTTSLELTNADDVFKSIALDVLLPGRGVAKIKYEPELTKKEKPESDDIRPDVDADEPQDDNSEPNDAGSDDTDDDYDLGYQDVCVEHIQWDDYRQGPGRTWKEVPWVAYRHRMPKGDVAELAGKEIADKIQYDKVDDSDIKKNDSITGLPIFSTAEVWEIWDKEQRECIFVAPSYKDAPLKTEPDPLGLRDFFPSPKPVYACEDSASLVPKTLYEHYKQQAIELDRVSARINILVDAMRVRGVYDSTIPEFGAIFDSGDNQFIASENAKAFIDRGGIAGALWFMPIDVIAATLEKLYAQREQCKQVIYEITGMSDIMRGASDPRETFGAQQLKSQWGSQRLQRLQRDMQRFIADIIKLMGEVIAENWLPDTLRDMSDMKLPSGQEKAQMQQQIQQTQQQMQMSGQQPSPDQVAFAQKAMALPSWDEVSALLKDDMHRTFRIDIETDSTVADQLAGDMQGMQEVLAGVVNFIQGIAPAVQAGAFPIEGVKAIVGTICRRARMGLEVEDALELIKAPPPAPPVPPPQDNSIQVAQIKAQSDEQERQHDMAMEQVKQQTAGYIAQQLEQSKIAAQIALGKLEADTKIIVAQITSQAQMQTAVQTEQIKQQTIAMQTEAEDARTAAMSDDDVEQQDTVGDALKLAIENFHQSMTDNQMGLQSIHSGIQAIHQNLMKPKTIVRDEMGRVAGVQ